MERSVPRASGMPRPAKPARQTRYARRADASVAMGGRGAEIVPPHAGATPSAKRRRRLQAAATRFHSPQTLARDDPARGGTLFRVRVDVPGLPPPRATV